VHQGHPAHDLLCLPQVAIWLRVLGRVKTWVGAPTKEQILLCRLSLSALTSAGTSEAAYPNGDVTPYDGVFTESFVREPSMGSEYSIADVTTPGRYAADAQGDAHVSPASAAPSQGFLSDGAPQTEIITTGITLWRGKACTDLPPC
jgi:hypothetical protein